MIEYMNQLEEKITRLAGLYASVREERDGLVRENTELKKRFDELERENQGLKETQDQVRHRVDSLIKRIEGVGE